MDSLPPGPYMRNEQVKHNLTGFHRFLERWANFNETSGLWNMSMIEDINNLMKHLPHLKDKGGQSYYVRGFDGNTHELKLPPFDPEKNYWFMRLINPLDLCQNIDDSGQFISKDPYHLVPYYAEVIPGAGHKKWDGNTNQVRECKVEGTYHPSLWDICKQEWHLTEFEAELQLFFERYGDGLTDVTEIVCFALGPLQSDIDLGVTRRNTGEPVIQRANPRRFMQHYFARRVCEEIERRRPIGSARIRIIAQDPQYDEGCKMVLWESLGIEAVADMSGFGRLTHNSLVISIAPSVDIVSMVFDILGSVGPRALICNEISLDTLNEATWKDSGVPWMKWDGFVPTDDDWIPTDPTSKLMTEYARGSYSQYFGDHKLLVGMTVEEFSNECAGYINLAELRHDWGVDPNVDKEKFAVDTEKDYDAVYYHLSETSKQVSKSYLGDLYLYMRLRDWPRRTTNP